MPVGGLLNVAFHPAEVIDDPGVMLVLLAGLTAVAAELTHRAVFRRGLP